MVESSRYYLEDFELLQNYQASFKREEGRNKILSGAFAIILTILFSPIAEKIIDNLEDAIALIGPSSNWWWLLLKIIGVIILDAALLIGIGLLILWRWMVFLDDKKYMQIERLSFLVLEELALESKLKEGTKDDIGPIKFSVREIRGFFLNWKSAFYNKKMNTEEIFKSLKSYMKEKIYDMDSEISNVVNDMKKDNLSKPLEMEHKDWIMFLQSERDSLSNMMLSLVILIATLIGIGTYAGATWSIVLGLTVSVVAVALAFAVLGGLGASWNSYRKLLCDIIDKSISSEEIRRRHIETEKIFVHLTILLWLIVSAIFAILIWLVFNPK